MLFWKILKYTYFEEHLRTAASEYIFPQTISAMMKNIKYLNLCLLERATGWGVQLYQKRDPDTGVFLWILQHF